jgi:hypothetical protein
VAGTASAAQPFSVLIGRNLFAQLGQHEGVIHVVRSAPSVPAQPGGRRSTCPASPPGIPA